MIMNHDNTITKIYTYKDEIIIETNKNNINEQNNDKNKDQKNNEKIKKIQFSKYNENIDLQKDIDLEAKSLTLAYIYTIIIIVILFLVFSVAIIYIINTNKNIDKNKDKNICIYSIDNYTKYKLELKYKTINIIPKNKIESCIDYYNFFIENEMDNCNTIIYDTKDYIKTDMKLNTNNITSIYFKILNNKLIKLINKNKNIIIIESKINKCYNILYKSLYTIVIGRNEKLYTLISNENNINNNLTNKVIKKINKFNKMSWISKFIILYKYFDINIKKYTSYKELNNTIVNFKTSLNQSQYEYILNIDYIYKLHQIILNIKSYKKESNIKIELYIDNIKKYLIFKINKSCKLNINKRIVKLINEKYVNEIKLISSVNIYGSINVYWL